MKFTSPVVLATLSVAISLPAFPVMAEEQPPIIVTATRTAQTADETISPTIVISRENLESQAGADITDVLHHYTGIDIGRNGGPGQSTSIFIRGANSNHTLIMMDGVSINPDIGNAAIQNIRLDMIERIEIVKGPRSTLYGSQAIGGVINIITRRDKKGSHYEIHAGHGSFNTSNVGFSAHNKTDKRAAGITVNVKQTDGFAIRTTSPIERGYDNVNLHLYGKKRMGESDLEISHWHSSGTTEYLDFFLNPLDQDFENNLTTVGINNAPSDNWVSKLKLSYMEDTLEQNQSTDISHTQRTAVDWQNDIQLNDANLLTAGLYSAHERAISNTNFNESTDHLALFMQNDMQSDSHHLITGIRGNDYEAFGNHTTWNLEYSYGINNNIGLILATNSGYRAPSSTDRFGFGGNPNLKAEESINSEFGLKYEKKNHKFRVSYYNNNIDNLINYVDPDGFAGPIPGSNENIDEVKIEGTEANYQYSINKFSIDINLINQDPIDNKTGTTLLRRAKEKYNMSLAYKGEAHRVQLDLTYVGERKDFGPTTLDSYTLVGLNAKYQATKRLSLNGRIENLTDEDYELAATYRTPERSYYVNLTYKF